jgi:GntR family transcriptional regulator
MTLDETRRTPVAVTAGAGLPLHRQLYLVLHDEIARGAIPAGCLLPTEQELCDQFGVSRVTVRHALADLANQGYITRRQGVGSFVREHSPAGQQAEIRSYMDEMRQIQFGTEADLLELDLRAAPQNIADKVGFAGDVLHVLRVRRERRTGEPLLVTEAWLPAALAEMITAEKLVDAAMYRLLADAGVSLERVQHEITAEIAGPRTAQLLDIAIGAAVLRVNRLAFVDSKPHHFLSILLSPSRSRILLNHTAEELAIGDTMAIAHDVLPETRRDERPG